MAFEIIDLDRHGEIGATDLRRALQQLGVWRMGSAGGAALPMPCVQMYQKLVPAFFLGATTDGFLTVLKKPHSLRHLIRLATDPEGPVVGISGHVLRLCGEPEPTDAEIQEMIRLMDPEPWNGDPRAPLDSLCPSLHATHVYLQWSSP